MAHMPHMYYKFEGKGVLLQGENKIYEKPDFKPQYLETNNTKAAILNAIIEIRTLWEYVINNAFHNYSQMYSRLKYPLLYQEREMCQKHSENFAVYDKITEEWLVTQSEPPYQLCYDGKDFIDFSVAKNDKKIPRFLLVGKFTKMMQEPNLVTKTFTYRAYVPELVVPTIKLIVGVPGCGKTRYIIKNHNPGSLVLTSGKEAAEDIRKRMAENNGVPQSQYSRSYRTIDSYLINKREPYTDVWVDEALMEHPGKLFLVCLFSRCRNLYLLGDPNQLGYINRTDVTLLYDKSSMFFKPAETLNVSYRCPVDVMAILSIKCDYEGRVYSASNVLRSLKCKTFTSLNNVPRSEDTKYLVFKQAEKKVMKEAGYDVSTVHEFQGKEAGHVVIVKMSHNSREGASESPRHLVVALSRHRDSLVYYSPVRDTLTKLMSTQVTDEELRSHQKSLWSYLTPVVESIHIISGAGRIAYHCGCVVYFWFLTIIVSILWFKNDRSIRNNNRNYRN
ncbi:uncharacterized protein LOC125230569 [Leguminivora glycinivorella]|uniref:uncharacterized protein LOC125230569 n=1 Tax=Leguminivora glycinivorella TaxID=1035111 RepID=UPI00200CBD2F|nr:uncharacterized protein LOC125230569 [Leguminivora glycinivorella]